MNLFDFILNVWYNLDPDTYLKVAVPGVLSGFALTLFSGRKKNMQYKVGDYVRINNEVLDPEGYGCSDEVMRQLNGKTCKVVYVKPNGDIRAYSHLGINECREDESWIYSVTDVTPSTKEQYEKDCGIMQPEQNEWTKFVNGVPEPKDAPRLEISEDGLSWRLKPLERMTDTEAETVSSEVKTETPDTKEETMGDETKKTETTKLNFTPITDTSGLEDGGHYIVLDDDAILYATSYDDDCDNTPSDNFEGVSRVAFYLNVEDLKPVLNIPSDEECRKVLEEESSVKDIVEESSLEDIAENWDEYSDETKAGLVKFLKEKGIIS